MSDRLEAALAYQARGWRVIQLHGVAPDGGCTCKRKDRLDPDHATGKHPVLDEWQKSSAMTEDEIRAAWAGWRTNHNIGLATGRDLGAWVLDIDPKNGGLESAKRLAEEHGGEFDATRVVKTGSGGFHYFFSLPDFEVRNSPGELKAYPGIDVRGQGGQVVAPPSVTNKGAYSVVVDAPFAPAPDWLLDMLRPKERATLPVNKAGPGPLNPEYQRLHAYARKAWDGEVARLTAMAEAAVPEGKTYFGEPWDATTFEVACNLIELANAEWSPYDVSDAEIAVHAHGPVDSGFTPQQVQKKIESARLKIGDKARPEPLDKRVDISSWGIPTWTQANHVDPPRVPAPVREWRMRSWDDVGNADRMVDHFGHRIRYVPGMKQWTLYDGGRWARVGSELIQALIIRMISALPTTEAELYDDVERDDKGESQRDKFAAFVKKQRMNSRVTAALNLTSSKVELHARLDDFDADPLLFNVANGVVDLAAGALRDHDPDLMLMKQTPVAYDPGAECKGWQEFLDRVMPDPEMQAYLQRIVGYSITGQTTERAFFIHYGNGANGKSVFTEVVRAVVGEYGQSVPRDTLLAKKTSEHPTSIARMAGMRYLEVSETGPGKRLDEEAVKGLTGGEQQTARLMGKDFEDFTPTGKIHYMTNFLPRLSDSPSIWDRLHLVHWGVTIPKEERELGLAQRLIREELPGVLAWAVRGAVLWSDRGLSAPASARHDIESYREEVDAFGDFLREHTLRSTDDVQTPVPDLYFAYRSWVFATSSAKPMSQGAFVSVMKERGYNHTRKPKSAFVGVTVNKVQEEVRSPWG